MPKALSRTRQANKSKPKKVAKKAKPVTVQASEKEPVLQGHAQSGCLHCVIMRAIGRALNDKRMNGEMLPEALGEVIGDFMAAQEDQGAAELILGRVSMAAMAQLFHRRQLAALEDIPQRLQDMMEAAQAREDGKLN